MTFAALLDDCYRRLGYQTSPASDVVTRLKAFLNETHREILGEPGFERLLEARGTFPSVADQAEYGLPAAIVRVHAIRDIANRIALRPMSLAQYRAIADPSSFTGTPEYYVLLGIGPAAIRPSNASSIFAKSTSASDTNTLHWEVISGGAVGTGSVTMTGATAVDIGAGSAVVQISDIYLSVAAVGTVTIHEDSGSGTELARIAPGQIRPQFWRVALAPTPADVRTYTVDGEREVTDLVQTTDQPVLPDRHHRLLAIGARMKEYELKGDLERRAITESEFKTALGNLRLEISPFASEGVIVPGGRRVGHSQLGPDYPADRWL